MNFVICLYCAFSFSFLLMYFFNCLSNKCGGYEFLNKYSLTIFISKLNVILSLHILYPLSINVFIKTKFVGHWRKTRKIYEKPINVVFQQNMLLILSDMDSNDLQNINFRHKRIDPVQTCLQKLSGNVHVMIF